MQFAIFTFCREWVDERQSFPSVRVIASAFRFKSQNAAVSHLESLIKKGYVERWEYKYTDSVRGGRSVSKGFKVTDRARQVVMKRI